MKKLIKLIILIIISLSVYFIYYKTNNSKYIITSIGDKLSMGINSFGVKEKSYIDYYKEYLEQEKQQVIVNKKYTSKTQSIKQTVLQLKNMPEFKRTISDSNLIIITLGYNDILYDLSIEEKYNSNSVNKIVENTITSYNELIKEIKKYYHNDIYVIGYYKTKKDNEYINEAIIQLNKYLKENKDIVYINTYDLFNNDKDLRSNPDSYYPNNKGYKQISEKIISKSLEIL